MKHCKAVARRPELAQLPPIAIKYNFIVQLVDRAVVFILQNT